MTAIRRRSMGLGASLVLAAALAGCGPAQYKAETKGSEEAMQDFQKTGTFYRPPAGAPVPGAAPSGPGGMGQPPIGTNPPR